MSGDITRSTFNPDKHYSGVRMQQGRVQTDADWNEQIDIAAHRVETEAADLIGRSGGPLHNPGFALTGGAVPVIGAGHYYVDGILCENNSPAPLDKQPDLPVANLAGLITPASAAVGDGLYIAYLDVWQRHLTALQDGHIREVALGGPDTATRTKTVWQVRLLGPLPGPLNCASEPEAWQMLIDQSNSGMLSARAAASSAVQGPCVVPPGAGYRRLENQLYRVEVHQTNAAGAATLLKWSRDNGAITARWLDQQASKPGELIVDSIGRDEVLRFAAGQYVELSDDQRELGGAAGILVRLANAEGQVLTLDTTDPLAATVLKADFPDMFSAVPNHPKARRWDGVVAAPATNSWIELESGVQILLGSGRYHVGDHWLIAARTATGDVEWPRDAAAQAVPQARAGTQHHYCKLAIVEHAAGSFKVVEDCRKLFPPLTELVTLLYAGGDGQTGSPGKPLTWPLQARVLNGQNPVVGAQVRFSVVAGGGILPAQPVVTTGPDGIAACDWTLGPTGPQEVEARLLDPASNPLPGQVLRFNASFSAGGDCCVSVGEGGDYRLLEEALDDLINRQGQRDICICLRPGDHEVRALEVQATPEQPALHIKIGGCARGSRLLLRQPARFTGVRSVLLHDLAVETSFVIEHNDGALAFESCTAVCLRGCDLAGITAFEANSDGILERWGALLTITNADEVRLEGNTFEALLPNSLEPTSKLFRLAEREGNSEQAKRAARMLAELLGQTYPRRADFRQEALTVAQQLIDLDNASRQDLAQSIFSARRNVQEPLTEGENFSLNKLILGMSLTLTLGQIHDLLLDLRRAAGKARPGTAIVLERLRGSNEDRQNQLGQIAERLDQDDMYIVERNIIAGVLGLYGPPAPAARVEQLLNSDTVPMLRRRLQEQQISFLRFLGTLQLSGNQLVRVGVPLELVQALSELAQPNSPSMLRFDLFSRCLWGDNVFEGGPSLVVSYRLTLHASEFSTYVLPPNQLLVGTFVGDMAIYLGNRGARITGPTGGPESVQFRDITRVSDQTANQDIEFV